ncbi:cytochrome c peroxidase [Nemorincola caseinilytica]|uniref:Cytochrome c peroxidase n=1 Tax=Nemorincola caseinilytica TaxID=2054315 RepID=A0ABP8N5C5_9BACT
MFKVPKGWPRPVYDLSHNPLSEKKILLGRALFHDPILSADSTISCVSCHLQYSAFTHVDHKLSHGIAGHIGRRNSPTLMNMAWGTQFMWDGAVNHLDMQPLAPIAHPDEMAFAADSVVLRFRRSDVYKRLFYEAWGDSDITGERFLKSMAQFMLTLVSSNSKYDKVMRHEDNAAFTPQEANGYRLFRANCEACHKEPLFTTNGFANNGLPIDTGLNDMGRMGVTGRPADSLLFKIPTLRNIEFSYPYMHDGRFSKLRDVVEHYATGIEYGPTLSPELRKPIMLSPNEKVDLVAFLLTLTDRGFLFDTAFSFPVDVLGR